jgi:hypothetical protein
MDIGGGIGRLTALTIGQVLEHLPAVAEQLKAAADGADEAQFAEIMRTLVLPTLSSMAFATFSESEHDPMGQRGKRTILPRSHSSSRMAATAVELEDRIPRPSGDQRDWEWKEEYKVAVAEGMRHLGKGMSDPKYAHRARCETLLDTKTGQAHVKMKIDLLTAHHEIKDYHKEEAQVLECLLTPPVRYAVGRASEEGKPDFAALTHIACDAIARNCKDQNEKGKLASHCFRYMTGGLGTGLADTDSRWETIDEPDEVSSLSGLGQNSSRTGQPKQARPTQLLIYYVFLSIPFYTWIKNTKHGFRGFTTYAPLKMRQPNVCFFSSAGLRVKDPSKEDKDDGAYIPVGCPVIRFVAKRPTGGGGNCCTLPCGLVQMTGCCRR